MTSNPRTHLLAALTFSVLAGLFLVGPAFAQHDPVSVHAAQAAMARGAVVLDVRSREAFALGHLPAAVSVPLGDDVSTLELAVQVSKAGVDVSREVVLVGEPGSEAAQRLHSKLARLSSGRVLWLVGGVGEWSLSGRALSVGPDSASKRLPVPQHLVAFDGADAANNAFAGASRRATPAGDAWAARPQ